MNMLKAVTLFLCVVWLTAMLVLIPGQVSAQGAWLTPTSGIVGNQQGTPLHPAHGLYTSRITINEKMIANQNGLVLDYPAICKELKKRGFIQQADLPSPLSVSDLSWVLFGVSLALALMQGWRLWWLFGWTADWRKK